MTTARRIGAALVLLVCACARPIETPPRPIENSLFAAAPAQQWRMPPRLREISGLATSPDGHLFGHDDEIAIIYLLDAERGELRKAFALGDPIERGDFEGLAITPSGEFYLTTSRGLLYRFREAGDGAHADFERFDTGLGETCEIEGLAYLAAEDSLILACKANEARAMRDVVSLHAWSPATGQTEAWLNVPVSTIAEAAGLPGFHPSAIELHSDRILLLAGREQAFAELSYGGDVLSARALGARHPQPEGLALSPDGALFIADEGAGGRALLSRYDRRQ